MTSSENSIHDKRDKDVLSSSSRRDLRWLSAAAIALIGGLGCAADSSSDDGPSSELKQSRAMPPLALQDEQALNLVAEVDLDGRRVKYFEPEPGVMVEVELGRADLDRSLEPDLPMLERYEYLTGKKAPAALAAAVERSQALRNELRGQTPVPNETREPAELTPGREVKKLDKAQAPSEQWFVDNYCVKHDRFWGTATGYWQGNSSFSDRTEYFRSSIYTAWGTVLASIACHDTVVLGSDPMPAGYYATKKCETVIDRRVTSTVRGADAAGYKHCINYHY